MASKNDITGDLIQSKGLSEQGKANFDAIFRKDINHSEQPHKDEENVSDRQSKCVQK